MKRLDTTSRSLFALIEPGSCFVGALAEIAFAADRQFMLEGQFEDDEEPAPPAVIRLDEFNTGLLPMGNDLTRLQVRFLGSADELAAAEAAVGRDLLAADALELGLVTGTPDDIDWEDEIRLVVEERGELLPRRADRHGGQPPLRRPGDRRRRRSSAGSPPGRTGSSSGPTPLAPKEHCAATAPASGPTTTGSGSDA